MGGGRFRAGGIVGAGVGLVWVDVGVVRVEVGLIRVDVRVEGGVVRAFWEVAFLAVDPPIVLFLVPVLAAVAVCPVVAVVAVVIVAVVCRRHYRCLVPLRKRERPKH